MHTRFGVSSECTFVHRGCKAKCGLERDALWAVGPVLWARTAVEPGQRPWAGGKPTWGQGGSSEGGMAQMRGTRPWWGERRAEVSHQGPRPEGLHTRAFPELS